MQQLRVRNFSNRIAQLGLRQTQSPGLRRVRLSTSARETQDSGLARRPNLFSWELVRPDTSAIQQLQRNARPKRELSQWSKFRGKANPYFRGLGKFMTNIRMAHSLVWDAIGGRILNVRERRVLQNTMYDMILLLPSAAIIALPGGSLLLPLVAKYIPWALPSTFQVPTPRTLSKLRKDGKAEAEVRDELNQRLTQTMIVMADKLKANHNVEVRLSQQVDMAVREFTATPKGVSPPSGLFDTFYELNDDAVINNLDHTQLHLLCQYFGATPAHVYGPSQVKRNWLFDRVSHLETEDLVLSRSKSLSSWPKDELIEACELRGIKLATESSVSELDVATIELAIDELESWIHLTVERSTPVSLVALSRALGGIKQ